MRHVSRIACTLAAAVMLPALASAQVNKAFLPPEDRATGERYHIEAGFGMWNPTPDMKISSGTGSSEVDAVSDLGITRKQMPQVTLILRASKKHKIRFEYVPISYRPTAVLSRTLTFQGNTYTASSPVNSTLDWKAYRFGYEYDFIYRSRFFIGFIADVKYTDVTATITTTGLLSNPLAVMSTAHAVAPIPALGGITRIYVLKNTSVTGEFTTFRLPGSVGQSQGVHASYNDFDVYGTYNVTNNVGVQAGYHSIGINFSVDQDAANFKLRGMYFRGVVRF